MNLDLTYEWVTIMSNKQSLAIGTSNTAVDACSSVGMEVNVLYTTTKATLSALRVAGKLAHDLGARIRVTFRRWSRFRWNFRALRSSRSLPLAEFAPWSLRMRSRPKSR